MRAVLSQKRLFRKARPMNGFVRGFSCVVVFCLISGCADPLGGRMEVTGAVKLKGEPLQDGLIIFVPLDRQDTQSGAPIVKGSYRVPREQGLKPGKYLVRLSAGDGKTPVNEEEAAGPGGSTNIISLDLIPEEWNTKSTQTREVTSTGPNRFDFDIPTINTPKKRR